MTILFTDIVEYTTLCGSLPIKQVVQLLDDLYCEFDRIAKEKNVYKVETIGDSYMAATACVDNEDIFAATVRMIYFAEEVLRTVKDFHPPYLSPGIQLEVRVGIHSGPVINN